MAKRIALKIFRSLIAAAFLLIVIFAWFTWNVASAVIQTLAEGPPAGSRPSVLADVIPRQMTGDMPTWLLTFIAGVAVVFLLGMAVNWLYRGFRTIREEFYCPWIDRSVQVTYLTLDGRRPVGVLSCSAFADTTGVLCGTPCLASGGRAGASTAEKEE